MSLRDDLLSTLVAGYQIVEDAGLRQTRVIVRSRTWSSGKIQTGTATISDLEIEPRPEVVGMAGDPVLKVGPIVPASEAADPGTYTPAQLNRVDLPDTDWFYLIIAPDGVERPYKLERLDTVTRPFRYMLDLTALDRKLPF